MAEATNLEGFECKESGCREFQTEWYRAKIHEKKFPGHKMEPVKYTPEKDPNKNEM